MIKTLILIITCAVVLNANVNEAIKNLLGSNEYATHKNLINYVFSNKQSYLNYDKSLKYHLIVRKLQNNGLLKLKYKAVKYIDISFELKGNKTKSLFILKDILKSLGHYYYFTQEAIYENDKLIWKIKLKTQAAINPLKLSTLLTKNNSKISGIFREGMYKWRYSLDFSNARIYKAKNLILNDEITLKKSIRPYFIEVSNLIALTIKSNIGNRWHPNVVFYDEELNIIEIYKDDSLQKSLRLDVPIDTKYIKIDDLHSLYNLRRGMSISKE